MNDTIGLQKITHQNKAFIIAWVFGLIFYFLEYVIRSSPAVMIPELSSHFAVDAVGVSTILSTYYFTYSVTSLIAGTALDRSGAKKPIPFGISILALGCFFFAVPSIWFADTGRMFQGAGSAFAFTGCVYLASHGFSSKYLAIAVGITQSVGMLGGSAGQFVVGPMIHSRISIDAFWIGVGVLCALTAVLLYFTTPKEELLVSKKVSTAKLLEPYKIVFTNTQSYLSGLLSGLLFVPTTIFAMTWGIAFFQQDRNLTYEQAVIVCSMVPFGWAIGCPLVGWISDLLGKRKPVLTVGILVMLLSFAQVIFVPDAMPAFLSMLLFGTASGVAMIPYTIIKEANPDSVKGSATGGINFLTFGTTALISPVFASLYGKTLMTATNHELHFRNAGLFILSITLLALIVSFIVRETGTKKV
ncbi:MFS transporter [Flavobacterium sp. 3-210]